ncbi:hypothetical protein HK103_001626 [Boothiomyces macroporosus]|uniref:F-box domain-containing protein n=1 Tax=Boothiomyces macroporosus TaxID=261099 RepID=A0AAD5Y0H3_9FUNG|nr:hypothetical protein HK103_001626 [Boothiomyces macroporosus]
MNLETLPLDLLENKIFYYLNGLDLIQLSMVNKVFRIRLQAVGKLCLVSDIFWPDLNVINSSDCHQLKGINWRFNSIYIDSLSLCKYFPYLPKTRDLIVELQRTNRDFDKALERNIITRINIPRSMYTTLDSIKLILKSVQTLTKLKSISIVFPIYSITTDLENLMYSNITSLSLKDCFIDDSTLERVSKSLPKKLQFLDLSFNQITNTGLSYLQLHDMKELILNYNRYGKAGIEHLVSKMIGSKLKYVSLKTDWLESSDLLPLLSKFHLTQLEKLHVFEYLDINSMEMLINNLPHSRVTELGLILEQEYITPFLKASNNLKKLYLYSLSNQACEIVEKIKVDYLCLQVSTEGLDTILPKLEIKKLNLLDNISGDSYIKVLCKHISLLNIKELYLDEMSDAGIAQLANSLPKISFLYIKSRRITILGIQKLLTLDLFHLDLECNVDPKVIRRFLPCGFTVNIVTPM